MAVLPLCTPLSLLLLAASAPPASPTPSDEPELALHGLDPVSLCEGAEAEGREDLLVTRGRYVYRFASEESRARFLEDPERWGVQWGGGCGRMGPLSGVGSPERWTVHDGRIYLFASDECRAGFLSQPERYVVEPEARPRLRARRARGRHGVGRARRRGPRRRGSDRRPERLEALRRGRAERLDAPPGPGRHRDRRALAPVDLDSSRPGGQDVGDDLDPRPRAFRPRGGDDSPGDEPRAARRSASIRSP